MAKPPSSGTKGRSGARRLGPWSPAAGCPGEAFARAYAFTLTIVANAMHVGDHLKERLG